MTNLRIYLAIIFFGLSTGLQAGETATIAQQLPPESTIQKPEPVSVKSEQASLSISSSNTGAIVNSQAISASTEKPATLTPTPAKPSDTVIRTLACLTLQPLPKVLNKYVKMLETFCPQQTSLLSLFLMGSLGGIQCPGISNDSPVYIPIFQVGSEFHILYFFDASDDAYLVKILQNLPKKPNEKTPETLQKLKVNGKDWYVFGPTSFVDRMKSHWGTLFQCFDPKPTSDLQITLSNVDQIASSLIDILATNPEKKDNGNFVDPNFLRDFLKIISVAFFDYLQQIQINLNLTDDLQLAVTSSSFFVPGTCYDKYIADQQKKELSILVPNNFSQCDTRQIGYCYPNACKVFWDYLFSRLATINIKECTQDGQLTINFLQSIQPLLNTLLDFLQKYSMGICFSSSNLKNESPIFYNCGQGALQTHFLKENELVNSLDSFVSQTNTWIKTLPKLFEQVTNLFLKSILEGLPKTLSCHFDRDITKYKDITIYACSISSMTEPVQIQAQLFFSLLSNDYLVYADNQDSLKSIIDSYLDNKLLTTYTLAPNIQQEIRINLNSIFATLSKKITVKQAADLSIYLQFDKSNHCIVYRLNVPLKEVWALFSQLIEENNTPKSNNQTSSKTLTTSASAQSSGASPSITNSSKSETKTSQQKEISRPRRPGEPSK